MQGQASDAVQAYRDLYRVAPHPENLYLLAKALNQAGRNDEAQTAFRDFERKALAESATTDNSNRELIYYFADVARNPSEAMRIARLETSRRRDAPTLEAYAWALLANERTAEAWREMETALAVGIRDAVSFYHAGVIAEKAGDTSTAKKYFRMSLETNAHSEVAHDAQERLSE
jgi:tetratricopeptide (TPR) repeat protein